LELLDYIADQAGCERVRHVLGQEQKLVQLMPKLLSLSIAHIDTLLVVVRRETKPQRSSWLHHVREIFPSREESVLRAFFL
jgi:hypothetical protein